MQIQAVKFWRTVQAKRQRKPEWGVLINEDTLIVDADGKPVLKPVFDYRVQADILSLALVFPEESGNKYIGPSK